MISWLKCLVGSHVKELGDWGTTDFNCSEVKIRLCRCWRCHKLMDIVIFRNIGK